MCSSFFSAGMEKDVGLTGIPVRLYTPHTLVHFWENFTRGMILHTTSFPGRPKGPPCFIVWQGGSCPPYPARKCCPPFLRSFRQLSCMFFHFFFYRIPPHLSSSRGPGTMAGNLASLFLPLLNPPQQASFLTGALKTNPCLVSSGVFRLSIVRADCSFLFLCLLVDADRSVFSIGQPFLPFRPNILIPIFRLSSESLLTRSWRPSTFLYPVLAFPLADCNRLSPLSPPGFLRTETVMLPRKSLEAFSPFFFFLSHNPASRYQCTAVDFMLAGSPLGANFSISPAGCFAILGQTHVNTLAKQVTVLVSARIVSLDFLFARGQPVELAQSGSIRTRLFPPATLLLALCVLFLRLPRAASMPLLSS